MKKLIIESPRVVEVIGYGNEGVMPLHPSSCPYNGETNCISSSGGSACNFLGSARVDHLCLPNKRHEGQKFIFCGESLEIEVEDDCYQMKREASLG